VGPRAGLDAVERAETSLPLPGIERGLSSPWPSHYTDCTIKAPACPTRNYKHEIFQENGNSCSSHRRVPQSLVGAPQSGYEDTASLRNVVLLMFNDAFSTAVLIGREYENSFG
jgi:hypothetical protein